MSLRSKYRSFVIIAGMRTGSNLLEELINDHPELQCHGELFNPHFVGFPDKDTAFGVTLLERDQDPQRLLTKVNTQRLGLSGFRIFDEHNARALEAALDDTRCAKIILTRNPLDSYISLKIARKTKQWWLGDMRSAKAGTVTFDVEEFDAFLEQTENFQTFVRHRLATSGQSAFQIHYDELRQPEYIKGLFRYLGVSPHEPLSSTKIKAQNPVPLDQKLTNPKFARRHLARLDPFDLDKIPGLEPARGGGAKGALIASKAPVLFLPIGRLAKREVFDWMTSLDFGKEPISGLGQRGLKTWMKATPGHQIITVVSHPICRAWNAYLERVVDCKDGPLKSLLERSFGHPKNLNREAKTECLRTGFLAYLTFVKGVLNGQTGFRLDADAASQMALLEGISRIRCPDHVLRLEALQDQLPQLARSMELPGEFSFSSSAGVDETLLNSIYDKSVERAARAAYRRDYAFLGYSDWRG